MEWYYAENNERRGPLGATELNDLIRSGRITPATQVWREGWPGWRAFSEAGDLTGDNVAGTENCVECHRSFPTSEMVQYSGQWVCPTCKPIFFQKVKEGIEPSEAMEYGGFWIRFLAKFIDGIILGVAAFGVQLPLASLMRNPDRAMAGILIGWFISMLIRLAYTTFLTGKYGATVGKMACGLKVVTPTGGKIGYGVACGRFFAELLSGLILAIGYIMAAFDEENRTLHDRICNTRVVRRRA